MVNKRRKNQGTIAIFCIISGCSFVSGSPEQGDKGDTGAADAAPQLEHCSLKVGACTNSCYKADLGLTCRLCCARNGRSCDAGGDYQFYACLDDK
jgi:hypothetical protein